MRRRLKLIRITDDFVIIFIGSLIVFSGIAYMISYPRLPEQFLEFYILNEQKLAADYYPTRGEWKVPRMYEINWYLGISNSMGSSELVLVKVKLGNSTTPLPDERSATPANLPIVFEFRRILLPNETVEIPFSWRILDTPVKGNLAYLTLKINGIAEKVETVGALKGENFRFIFELWIYDVQSGQYMFGWESDHQRETAWLQMWFTAV